MSLLYSQFEDFTIIDRRTVMDNYGGVETAYVDGATIQAALSYDGSTEMKVAQAAGVTTVYTISVKKEINLDFHMILRQEKTGRIFRLMSNGDDNETPEQAALNVRQYSAELFTLPKN